MRRGEGLPCDGSSPVPLLFFFSFSSPFSFFFEECVIPAVLGAVGQARHGAAAGCGAATDMRWLRLSTVRVRL